jgi:hypothetical protein
VSAGSKISVNIKTAGTYKLVVSVVVPTLSANSFWVDIDADPANDDTRCWDLLLTSTPQNQTVTWRGANSTTTSVQSGAQFNPKIWTLAAGLHTLYIDVREPGTGIQTVQFLAVAGPTPTPTPTPTPSPTPTPTVSLAWDADTATSDPKTNTVGYRVHTGTSSGHYTQTTDVGNKTAATIAISLSGSTYFFVVAAYNIAGVEGPFSNEVSVEAP